jgi:hypothetical protein
VAFVAAADFGGIRIARAIGGYRMNGAPASLSAAMSILWTHSRASALAATRAPRAIAPSDREPRQVLPTAPDADDVRRSDDGAIDVEFYKARAYAIRRDAQVRFAQALRRRARFVLKCAREFIRGGR